MDLKQPMKGNTFDQEKYVLFTAAKAEQKRVFTILAIAGIEVPEDVKEQVLDDNALWSRL